MVYCFMVCRFIVFWLTDLLVYLVTTCLFTGLLAKAGSLVRILVCVWDDTLRPAIEPGSWGPTLTLYGTTLCRVIQGPGNAI